MFADLRDYTAFVEQYGDQAAVELLNIYRALVRAHVERHDGAEVKTEGDSFFLVFPSASSAIDCAMAIVTAAREATNARPDRPIRVGIGIHAGETAESTEGVVGSAVNIAARVAALAKPFEVVVTDVVRGLTRTSLPYGFASLGARHLKGVREPVGIYRIVPEGGAAPANLVRGPHTVFARRLGTLAGAGLVILVIAGASIVGMSALNALGPNASPPRSQATQRASSPSSSPAVATPIATSTVEKPSGRWIPALVDVPGEGVLMFGGIAGGGSPPTPLREAWSFKPADGWTQLDGEVLIETSPHGDLSIARPVYDSGLVWLLADTRKGSEIWTYEPGQNAWRLRRGAVPRPGIGLVMAAFDSESRQLVIFGGRRGAWPNMTDETWAYGIDTGQLIKMQPALSPPARFSAGMDYDASSDRVILFGGFPGLGDTWAYDFNSDTWTEMEPRVAPAPTSHGIMTYDPIGDRMILFGGEGAGPTQGGALADTWSYDYDSNTWTQLHPATVPSYRELPGAAYDAAAREILLFGGGSLNTFEYLDDTWLYDPAANNWIEWSP